MILIFLGLSLAALSVVGLVTGGASVLPPLFWLALAGIAHLAVVSGLIVLRETS